jgi:hypothetical protein
MADSIGFNDLWRSVNVAIYGYRIHTVQPQIQRSRRYLQINDVSSVASSEDACDELENRLNGLKELGTLFGSPTYFVSAEEDMVRKEKQDATERIPYFTVLDVTRFGRSITVAVEQGQEADHDGLRSREGDRESIKGKAAVRDSTVIFIFPQEGPYAFMVSEVRGRSYGGERLVQWLSRTTQRDAITFDGAGNKLEAPWLNWNIEPQMDGERLDGILSGSANFAFKLRRRTLNAASQPGSYDLEVVQFGLKQKPIERVLEVLMNIANRAGVGTEAERRARAAEDVLTLVGDDIMDADFTDGELSFDEQGKRQTVNAESIDKLFIYPTGFYRLQPSALKEKSAQVLGRVAVRFGIEL